MSLKIIFDSICLVIVVIVNYKSGSMIFVMRIVVYLFIIENENFVIVNEVVLYISVISNVFELFFK